MPLEGIDGVDAGEEDVALGGHEHELYASVRLGVVGFAPVENHRKVAMNESNRANR